MPFFTLSVNCVKTSFSVNIAYLAILSILVFHEKGQEGGSSGRGRQVPSSSIKNKTIPDGGVAPRHLLRLD